jgi:uncharacterized protein (DUF433 family)/predicted transcriptional regulator
MDITVLGGKPVIEGTRIPVHMIVELLASGMTEDEVLKEYPNLRRQDIRAALEYASTVVRQEEVVPLRKGPRRRSMVDVMADVLRVAAHPSSTTQILYAANLSYDQARKYLDLLTQVGLLSKTEGKGRSEKFVTTSNGQLLLSQMSNLIPDASAPEAQKQVK